MREPALGIVEKFVVNHVEHLARQPLQLEISIDLFARLVPNVPPLRYNVWGDLRYLVSPAAPILTQYGTN